MGRPKNPISVTQKKMRIGKECEICGEFFEIDNLRDQRVICPECKRKLREMLYPDDEEQKRICTACGEEMDCGYVINDGEEYYCSDECLNYYYSPAEYEDLCESGCAYWTQWEIPQMGVKCNESSTD